MDKNTSKNVDKIVQSYKADDLELVNNSSAYYIVSEIMGYRIDKTLKEQIKEQSKFIHIYITNEIVSIDNPSEVVGYGKW